MISRDHLVRSLERSGKWKILDLNNNNNDNDNDNDNDNNNNND
jgi:hypothetical protein